MFVFFNSLVCDCSLNCLFFLLVFITCLLLFFFICVFYFFSFACLFSLACLFVYSFYLLVQFVFLAYVFLKIFSFLLFVLVFICLFLISIFLVRFYLLVIFYSFPAFVFDSFSSSLKKSCPMSTSKVSFQFQQPEETETSSQVGRGNIISNSTRGAGKSWPIKDLKPTLSDGSKMQSAAHFFKPSKSPRAVE